MNDAFVGKSKTNNITFSWLYGYLQPTYYILVNSYNSWFTYSASATKTRRSVGFQNQQALLLMIMPSIVLILFLYILGTKSFDAMP